MHILKEYEKEFSCTTANELKLFERLALLICLKQNKRDLYDNAFVKYVDNGK